MVPQEHMERKHHCAFRNCEIITQGDAEDLKKKNTFLAALPRPSSTPKHNETIEHVTLLSLFGYLRPLFELSKMETAPTTFI